MICIYSCISFYAMHRNGNVLSIFNIVVLDFCSHIVLILFHESIEDRIDIM